MQSFSREDVEAIVRLLSKVGDPQAELSLADRKRTLLEGVAELVGADVWIWSMTVKNPGLDGDMATQGLIDGGWRSEEERVGLFRILTEPETAIPIQASSAEITRRGKHVTIAHTELIPPEVWDRVSEPYHALDLRYCLFSFYPMNETQFSAIGLHRRSSRPPFSSRERGIVHVVFQQVDWLHRQGSDIPAGSSVLSLTGRERQVLMFLLGGDTRREIANKLQLSEHTVGDYMKNIYRQLNVRSRGELLSLFISGGQAL